jgi:hypothetical protein
MSYDLTNHVLYGEFFIEEYTVTAWQPGSDSASREMVLQVFRDGDPVLERTCKMDHDDRYGPDADDIEAFNDVTEAALKELGLE